MSYNYPNQGGYAPPYQGHSPVPPQQGWAQAPPPDSQYQSHSPYPQDRNYPPPMQNQQYPPAQNYQQPPPGQYGAPPNNFPQQQYGAPPNQWQQPPPNQWQQPPPGQAPYGAAPPNQYQQNYPPPPQQYGQAPPNQWQQPPPPPATGQYHSPSFPAQQPYPTQYGAQDLPSLGYGPQQTANINMSNETEALFKAFKGFGTNEKEVIRILAKLDPIQAATLREQYKTRFMQDLGQRIEKEISGYFRDGAMSIVQGPLVSDCINLKNAVKGMGTKEVVLDDVLVGRSNADINAIKAKYQEIHGTSLEADLRGDLSAGTEDMFVMIISARRAESAAGVNHQEIEQHVGELQSAMGNFVSKNTIRACELILYKNDQQTNALAEAWQRRFNKSLAGDIKSKFSGHMQDVLLLYLARAQNRALSDAIQLEDSMAGLGTKDKLLVQRVIRVHWDRQYVARVRQEYQNKYKKDLVKRIKGETSGDYQRLMVACVE